MAKKVRLTWKNDNLTITEDVLLLEENDPIFTVTSDNPLMVVNNDGEGSTISNLMADKVLFEDEDGIFGLDPKDVVHIEEID